MEQWFFLRFLVSSLGVSLLTLVIAAIKRVGKKHISVKWQYNIWIIFLVMLSLPFIPEQFLEATRLGQWGNTASQQKENEWYILQGLTQGGKTLTDQEKGLQDYALAVDDSVASSLNNLCLGLWFLGAALASGITLMGALKLRTIKCSLVQVDNPSIRHVFDQCKAAFGIRKSIVLGTSSLVETPIAFGWLKTYIILPQETIDQLSMEDIKYILLHELCHYKQKDMLMNNMMCAFQIIYWFNPLVYWGFKKMRTDREMACDNQVLKLLDQKDYVQYGRTIINFAQIVSRTVPVGMTANMGGSKKQIKKRIEQIAYYKKETKLIRIKSWLIFIGIGVLIFSQAPVLSVMAYENRANLLEEQQVVYEDLSAYFDGMKGSFVLYDLEADTYHIYNKDGSMKRVSPNSTYKIYSALIGLEEGVIQEGHSKRQWDGIQYPYEPWNQDTDLYGAMQNSVNWYFQQLDEAVGMEKLQFYFDELNYGNKNLSGGISRYWMESSLQISLVEQVNLLKDLYTQQLKFKPEHIELVKDTLKLSEKEGATLSGKTGTGLIEGKGSNGTFIGYVEEAGKTYLFATQIESQDQAQAKGTRAMEITLEILKARAIY